MAATPKAARLDATLPRFSSSATPTFSRSWWIVLIAIGVLAAGLRIAAARGELWLDEVWSIALVEQEVQSPADVVLRLRHDNNHMLNSWVAYALGPQAPAWMYRAPAVIAGIAVVVLASWAQWRLGPPTVIATAAFVGLSYLLVHYSSEARGYAYLCFFIMLAYGALLRAEESCRVGWEVLVTASCIAGFLAHPLFLTMYLAIQIWTWLPDGKALDRKAARHLALAACFRSLLPGMFFAWLYWVNLRRMEIGGGDVQPYFKIVLQTLSLACGGGFDPPASWIAAAVSLALTSIALVHVFRDSPRRAAFYAAIIFLIPLALLVVAPRGDIYPRYFLGSVLFCYLLWSELLGAAFARFRHGRSIYVALLLAFAAANILHVTRLIKLGRSHYREAIALMEDETAGPTVNLAADHGFRHSLLLDHASRQMSLEKSLVFEPRDPNTLAKADWLLTHSLDPSSIAPAALRLNDVYDFELKRCYPFAGLSGWQLNVYRRKAVPAGPVKGLGGPPASVGK